MHAPYTHRGGTFLLAMTVAWLGLAAGEATAQTAVEDGTITVSIGGDTRSFEADGRWGPFSGSAADGNPHWLEFYVEAGSPPHSGNPGMALFVSYDPDTGRVPDRVEISNNELWAVKPGVYNNVAAGNPGPTIVITTWDEAPDDRRIIQGSYEVELDDGRAMTGTFDLTLPSR
ncbi:MAG: hypothetical protein ACR2QM_05380 [Longimicrobiales bacterium]